MASFSSCSDVIGKDSGSLAKRLQALVRRVSVDRATVSSAREKCRPLPTMDRASGLSRLSKEMRGTTWGSDAAATHVELEGECHGEACRDQLRLRL